MPRWHQREVPFGRGRSPARQSSGRSRRSGPQAVCLWRAVIEVLLPSAVAVIEAVPGAPIDALLVEERAVIAVSVPRRREEFTLGRSCARRALRTLGQPPCPILPGIHREPMWPPGFVGSITHCSGYCAAAVAQADEIVTVGIDAELDEPLPGGVLEQVAVPMELEWLRSRLNGGICWDRLLFSAKESAFKAWFPLAERWLGFDDARIVFAPDAATFEAQLLVEGPLVRGVEVRSFTGRYLVRDGLVLTAIAMTAA